VIRGCIPKKLMRYGALFVDHFKASKGYGWRPGEPALDWRALIEARNREIDRLNGIYLGMLEKAGVELVKGRGRVTGPNTVEFEGRSLTAERILVAVGAKPTLLETPGIEHVITSDDALENLAEKPARMAVLGAGYIGLELASIFCGLGVQTALIFRRDLPLRGFDDDLRAFLKDQLQARGMDVRPKTEILEIHPHDGRLRLQVTGGPLEVDQVLYATGRDPVPNTTNLGLEALGVELTGNGAVKVDKTYRSSVPSILAVGDCSDHAASGLDSGSFDLTPVAIAEGRAIAEGLWNDNPHEINYDTVPTAVFSLPEAAAVGLTEAAARKQGLDVRIFKTSFRPLLHTLTDEPVKTMMKMVVDRATDRVVGCHMVGDAAGEIIQGLAVAMTAGATKSAFDETVGLHPSAAEEFVTMYQPSG
jgi:glutathione reductase (NADPH)